MMISGDRFKPSGDAYYLTKDVGIQLSKLNRFHTFMIKKLFESYIQFKKLTSDVINM